LLGDNCREGYFAKGAKTGRYLKIGKRSETWSSEYVEHGQKYRLVRIIFLVYSSTNIKNVTIINIEIERKKIDKEICIIFDQMVAKHPDIVVGGEGFGSRHRFDRNC